jgi:hypothetical protein
LTRMNRRVGHERSSSAHRSSPVMRTVWSHLVPSASHSLLRNGFTADCRLSDMDGSVVGEIFARSTHGWVAASPYV